MSFATSTAGVTAQMLHPRSVFDEHVYVRDTGAVAECRLKTKSMHACGKSSVTSGGSVKSVLKRSMDIADRITPTRP
jgi:hypothetical protein